ncbi:cytochrome p450 [Trifolium pratense]|uniref:Cytochrome p450 n=1 Tax=Trifolium pratense TaxID=57577 RepID=A0A2K3NJJ2_TRIPR|nr:cytochrome p450 [Trifolium pratense]
MRLWQNVVETGAQILEPAFHLIEDWKHANSNKLMQHAPVNVTSATAELAAHSNNGADRVGTVWKKPAIGRYKCNIDVLILAQRDRGSLGMCIHDDKGWFVLAKTMWISPIYSVDLGEALRLFFFLQLGS